MASRGPQLLTVARAIAFGASISVAGLLFGREGGFDSEVRAPFRPPDWAFGAAWLLLYSTTGAAWASAGSRADVALGVVTALCCLWLLVYVTLGWKRVAAGLLVLACAASLASCLAIGGREGAMVAPLVLWTGYASSISLYELKP